MRGFTLALIILIIGLGGCSTTPEERAQKAAAMQAALDAKADKACQGYGFRPGTAEYASCRLPYGPRRQGR